jgi:transcriptional regulator with XRE-family HTH domain
MKISNENTDTAVLRELGSRLRRARLERNLSQSQLAEEAGVGRVTVQRIEEGESASMTKLIRVLRTLGLLEDLDQLVPEPRPSPIEQLRRQGRQRQRARAPRAASEDAEAPSPWRWGDELADESES